jgi:hypothetical protein
MRKVVDGSRIDRGRKKRRNIKKQVVRNPATLAQTIRLRILFTGRGRAFNNSPRRWCYWTSCGCGQQRSWERVVRQQAEFPMEFPLPALALDC